MSFSTYLADDVEPVEAGPDTLRFVFSEGDLERGAALEVIVLPSGTTADEARGLARAAVGGEAALAEEVSERGMVASYRRAPGSRAARADLVRDGERWVILLAWHPTGLEGVEPRLRHVRATWVWDATGEPLQGPEN